MGLASNYLAVEGRLTAVGRRIQVYVDAGDIGSVDSATLEDLVATFDERIFPAGGPVRARARRRPGRPFHRPFSRAG